MIILKPKRFQPKTMKNLYAHGAGPFKILKNIGPNAYMLEVPPDLRINPTFNVSDLVEYRKPALIPSEPFEPDLLRVNLSSSIHQLYFLNREIGLSTSWITGKSLPRIKVTNII